MGFVPPPFLSTDNTYMCKKITEPTAEDEKLLSDIVENSTDYVTVRGRRWGVKWIRNRARRKMTDILLNEKDEDKVVCKCAAALRLNGYFKILLFYWVLWRWYYYVRQYGEGELIPFISLCKKKVPAEEYLIAIMLLTGMKDTVMNLTRAEAERIRAAHSGGRQAH